LRKVLGPEAIATISGRGYRFALELTTAAGESAVPRNNLPLQLTSFIGREKEIAELKELLGTTRLLTLTGAGGCGKTRLAMQVAGDLLESYSDGIWLVELAALAEPGFVPQTVANVLGLKERQGRSLTQTISEHLASRHLLLVLDNAEHLLAACAEFADVALRQSAQVVILVTSRERLGIAGELTYRVPSLSVPDPSRTLRRRNSRSTNPRVCSSSGRGCSGHTSRSPHRTRRRWLQCAIGWTVSRSRLSWRRRACARCRWKR